MNQSGHQNLQDKNVQPNDLKNHSLSNKKKNLQQSKVSKVNFSGKYQSKNQEANQNSNQQFFKNFPQYQENEQDQTANLIQQQKNTPQKLNQKQKKSQTRIVNEFLNLRNQSNLQMASQISQKNGKMDIKSEQNLKIIQLSNLLNQLQNQLSNIRKKCNDFADEKNTERMIILQQHIQTLQIKINLHQKMLKQKQLTSLDRINHLDHIFKHYCTHIFKTGKHMTFERLQYEKVHLTIDRFFVFIKDFNLTSIKTKDNKIKEIIDKQEVLKLFKKVSPNCRDLNFQQFIIMIEKLGEIYFDSKITFQQRKVKQRKQKLKMKEKMEKKQKIKRQIINKHKQKMQNLERVVQTINSTTIKKMQTQQGQNDDLVQQLMNENQTDKNILKNNEKNDEQIKEIQQVQAQNKVKAKIKKSSSQQPKSFKKQPIGEYQSVQQHHLISLTKQQKRQYFYQIINVDDVQSFIDKLRELNLPLFKIYASQKAKDKEQQKLNKVDQRPDRILALDKQKQEQEKRLKELREKLNERNQKLKKSVVPLLSKEEYQMRKLKRSRMQQQQACLALGIKDKQTKSKIDLSNAEINLQSLSKLSYQNLNLTKFDPKSLFSKEQDDKIFLKEYDITPVKPTNLMKNYASLSRVTQNSRRVLQQKDKSSSSFLQKLKHRQSQVQINQKNQQISQLYRLNDRNQRQKKLVDKFLQKKGS